jgi:putative flippase GtrA
MATKTAESPVLRRGRHRRPSLLRKIGSEHGKRLVSFSLIGFGLFAVGIALQAFLVQVAGIPKVEAFIIQLAVLVQVNFLANYRWTWGDRDAPFWRSCWRYNLKRLGGLLLNFALYPVLIHFGMNYLAANALLVVALTPANYVLGHFWTFAGSNKAAAKMTENAERQIPLQDYS